MSDPHAAIVSATEQWLLKAVIGLNLCPFAKAVWAKRRVRIVVSPASTEAELVDDLIRELEHLHAADAEVLETTLLVHPSVLADFFDYNDFLDAADAAVEALGLEGEIQVASFHPHYQFADTGPDAVENATNRSPHPTLHLLREASITRAVESYPDIDDIPARNIETLRQLGREGFEALMAAPTAA